MSCKINVWSWLIFILAFAKANYITAQQFQSDIDFQDSVDYCVAKSQVATTSNAAVNAATGNYDVKYVRLELDTDPSLPQIGGTVTTHYEAVSDLNQLIIELASNMNVSSITQRGQALVFNHNAQDEIEIDLPQVQLAGVLDSLSITYSGNPISSGFGSFAQTTHAGSPIIWTLSEPYGAKAWWPCKQDLNDKIDHIDVYINTPSGNTGVSNGLLQSEITTVTGKRFHWKHNYPIPAYLIAIAVTNYSKYTDVVPGPQPLNIDNYVYPESIVTAQSQTGITIPIMQFFESTFGDYPFRNEKYGHAQFGWGGGMEHTTISFMGTFNQGLIAHELAHQWFGNKVTCGSWQDIWLNESFATYATGMSVEHLNGDASFKNWRNAVNNSATLQANQSVYVPAADTLSVSRVFSGRMSYNKGGMVLHMLRRKIGDATFNQGLRNYLNDPNLAFNYAKTGDFKAIMEQQSGENLTEFFDDWIYGEGYPSHQADWSMINPTTLRVTMSQLQSHPSVSFFEGIIPLKVYGVNAGEEQDLYLDIQSDGQVFDFTVPFNVIQLEIDPDVHTISRNNNATLGLDVSAFAKANFNVFPNPTKDIVHIKSIIHDVESWQLYDLSGRVIQSTVPMIKGYREFQIELPKSSGLYILKINTQLGVFTQRVIKR